MLIVRLMIEILFIMLVMDIIISSGKNSLKHLYEILKKEVQRTLGF